MIQPRPTAPADGAPFESFYAAWKDRVLCAVLASTGDDHDAEDCTAEAFSRALECWNDVRTRAAPAAWVVRTAVNLHIDRHRHHQRTLRLLPTLVEDDRIEPAALPIDPALLAALRALPERPVIDRTYPLSQTPEAMHYLEEGHLEGKVVVTVAGNGA
jgi:DNA-directed RNA polymerase specialized sigma24 family protein